MRIVLNFQSRPIPSAKPIMTNETPAQMRIRSEFSLAESARPVHVTHRPRTPEPYVPSPDARKGAQTGDLPESRWPQGLAFAVSHCSRWL